MSVVDQRTLFENGPVSGGNRTGIHGIPTDSIDARRHQLGRALRPLGMQRGPGQQERRDAAQAEHGAGEEKRVRRRLPARKIERGERTGKIPASHRAGANQENDRRRNLQLQRLESSVVHEGENLRANPAKRNAPRAAPALERKRISEFRWACPGASGA